jgi:DNA-directed RNA polymerase specialized sigma24 family protein
MRNFKIHSLLQHLSAYLLNKGWLGSRRRTADLPGLLDTVVDHLGGLSHPAIGIARARLEGAPVLRIDADESQIEETPEGVWVRGWIWVEQEALLTCNALRTTKLRKALAQLPPRTREVFLDHCVGGLPYPAIALRLNLEVGEVQDELAAALAALSAPFDEPY